MTDEREGRDESLEPVLRELRRSYNAPPATPREAIWARIEAERAAASRPRPRFLSPRVWVPLAAAAALAFGFMLGRDSLREDAARHVARLEAEMKAEQRQAFFEMAAVPVLSSGEALLTQARTANFAGTGGVELSSWASRLLVQTRLLLDSPAAGDPALQSLLQDLELVLVRIKRAAGGSETDRQMLRQGLEDGHLLLRLRAKIPAGDAPRGV